MAGMFANAKTIATPAPKGRKVATPEVEIKGMERLAALDAAIKSLEALKAAEEAAVKGEMSEYFITEGEKTQTRPVNFNGVENAASGSCQLKLRSSASALNEDEQILLAKHGIAFTTNIKTAEAFLINPAYTNNMALLAKVEEALADVDLPEDFLMKQPEVSTKIVSDESIDQVFKKSAAEMELLLPAVTTMAIRPKIEGDFWSILDSIMSPVDAKAA